MNLLKQITTAILAIFVFTAATVAQGTSNAPDSVTLFKNVKVFNGLHDRYGRNILLAVLSFVVLVPFYIVYRSKHKG